MAIDRGAITQGIFQGSQVPATAFVPASFTGAYQDGVCDACTYDPVQAKELAAAGRADRRAPRSNFQFNTGGGPRASGRPRSSSSSRPTSGSTSTSPGVPFRDLLTNQQQPTATGLFRAGWGADYPTPGNFLAPLLSTAAIGAATPNDVANGRQPRPLQQPGVRRAGGPGRRARRTTRARNDLYKQAEKIAIGDDLALIPLFTRQQFRLVNTTTFGNVEMDFSENPTARPDHASLMATSC